MKRYDLSKIMNRAWYIRKRSFNMSMSEALKEAWKRIKNEVAMQEAFENRMQNIKPSMKDVIRKTITITKVA